MAVYISKEFEKFLAQYEHLFESEVIELLRKRYSKCNEHYLRSDEFESLLTRVSSKLTADFERKHVHIQEVTRELKAFKCTRKRKIISEDKEIQHASPKRECISDDQGKPSRNNSTTTTYNSNNCPPQSSEQGSSSDQELPTSNLLSVVTPEKCVKVLSTKCAVICNSPRHNEAETKFSHSDERPRSTGSHEKQIKRLEDALGKFSKEIERLEETEISVNNLADEESNYILLDKYKKKFVKIWNKLCDLKGRAKYTGRPCEKIFRYEGSRYPDINKKVEKFINKHKVFPDYQDVREIILHVNKTRHLNLGKKGVDSLSKEIFVEVGTKLQDRRVADYKANFGSHLTDRWKDHDDPASYDRSLKRKLEENQDIAKKNIDEVIAKYSYLEEVTETESDMSDVREHEDADIQENVDIKNENAQSEENEEDMQNTNISSITDVEHISIVTAVEPKGSPVQLLSPKSRKENLNKQSNYCEDRLKPTKSSTSLPLEEALKDPERLKLPEQVKKKFKRLGEYASCNVKSQKQSWKSCGIRSGSEDSNDGYKRVGHCTSQNAKCLDKSVHLEAPKLPRRIHTSSTKINPAIFKKNGESLSVATSFTTSPYLIASDIEKHNGQIVAKSPEHLPNFDSSMSDLSQFTASSSPVIVLSDTD